MDKRLFYQVSRLIYVTVCIIAIYFIIKYMFILFYPFAFAILLSFFLDPLVSYLESKFKFSRFFATVVIVLLLFISTISLIMLIITEIIQGAIYLAEKVPSYFQSLLKLIESLLHENVVPFFHKITSLIQTLDDSKQLKVNEYIENLINYLASSGAIFLQDALLKIPYIVSIIPYSFTIVIFILIATFLMTNDWHRLKKTTAKLIPVSMNRLSRNVFEQFKKSFLGYLKAQCILIMITTMLLLIGLLVLSIDHALTISLIVALIDFIPLIGIGIIFIPWIIYLFIIQKYSLTIGLTILYMFIIIMRQMLEPKILSVNIGISPLASLFALFISVRLWGITGVIIAPILLILVSSVHQAGITKLLWNYVKG